MPEHLRPPWLAILVLAATAAAAAAQEPPRPAATLALLIEQGAAAESEAVFAPLTKALEADAEFRVLDRDRTRQVLREHALSLAGAVQAPVRTGRILGASYLLYAEPRTGGPRPTAALLCIEVGSGNVLYERAVALGHPQDAAASPAWVAEVVTALKACIRQAEQSRSRPSATVLSVTNQSESRRLEFLEDSLRGILEDRLEAKGYRVLRRRYAGLLAGETALGTSGLVRPDAAVLAEAADLVVAATFAERPSADTPFERTPIRLGLTVTPKGAAAAVRVIPFTLAGMKDLLPQLEQAIPSSGATAPPRDSTRAEQRVEAARLMADLKPLEFVSGMEDHQRQVETARRIIYLDPSAKDAYYRLGISLDALTRSRPQRIPWTPRASRQIADIMMTYLGSPDIDPEKGRWAYSYAMLHLTAFPQEQWDEALALMVDCVRWRHSLDPVNPPLICWPDYRFAHWWDAHPAERLAFLKWVDRLYTGKKHLSVFPYKVACAYQQLGDLDSAAAYLYDAFVSHAPDEPEFNSIIGGNSRGWWREAAERLDAERRGRLSARIEKQERRWRGGPKIAELYGGAFDDPGAGSTDMWSYYLGGADRFLLKRLKCPTVTPEPIEWAPGNLRYSFVLRRTAAGLWMQGITADGKLALALLPAEGPWRPVALPEEMQNVAHFIVEAAQAGKAVFFALAGGQGVAVYDVEAGTWRFVGLKEGLGSNWVWGLAADGPDVWVTGGGFLSRCRAGSVFLCKDRVPWWTEGLAMAGGNAWFLSYEPNLTICDPAGKEARRTVAENDFRRLYPVPDFFWPPARGYNAGRVGRRMMLARPEGLYVATKLGLALVGNDGRRERLWYPAGYCYWESLGAWVEGNCPLPPCIVKEVIADDRDPDLIWLVSKRNVSYPPCDESPVGYIDCYLSQPEEDAATFITAFDAKKRAFSAPVRTAAPFLHAQPFGDFLYVTGKKFGRIPKTTWVPDQPAPAGDQPVRAHCPDTPIGRAAKALFDQDFERARKHLAEAIGAGPAPDEVKEMLAAIERMQKARRRSGQDETPRSQAPESHE